VVKPGALEYSINTNKPLAKRIKKAVEDAKRSVIVYRVPLWFELQNSADFFGEELACYRTVHQERNFGGG
jgi:hypothetical protein